MKKVLYWLVEPTVLISLLVAYILHVQYSRNLLLFFSAIFFILNIVSAIIIIFGAVVMESEEIAKKATKEWTEEKLRKVKPIHIKYDLFYEVPLAIAFAALGGWMWIPCILTLFTVVVSFVGKIAANSFYNKMKNALTEKQESEIVEKYVARIEQTNER